MQGSRWLRRVGLGLVGSLALGASAASAATEISFILNWVAGGDHAPVYWAKSQGLYESAMVLATPAGMPRAAALMEELRSEIPEVELVPVAVRDPSDYSELFHALAPVVERLSCLPELDIVLSAGTPQLTELSQIARIGLRADDFARHDPSAELLVVNDRLRAEAAERERTVLELQARLGVLEAQRNPTGTAADSGPET